MTKVRVVLAGGLLALTGAAALAADTSPMAYGRWHRRTVMDVPTALKSLPAFAELDGKVFESDLCIGPDRAARGPVAIALADDGHDCRVKGVQIQGQRFTARRECRLDGGKTQVSILSGQFSGTALAFSSTAQIADRYLTSRSAYTFTGACQTGDIQAP